MCQLSKSVVSPNCKVIIFSFLEKRRLYNFQRHLINQNIKVVNKFIHDITDHVFLGIERDDEVMRDYMTNVNRYGLDAVNMAIGLKIKECLCLENDGENPKPKSRLIKSYTFHKK